MYEIKQKLLELGIELNNLNKLLNNNLLIDNNNPVEEEIIAIINNNNDIIKEIDSIL